MISLIRWEHGPDPVAVLEFVFKQAHFLADELESILQVILNKDDFFSQIGSLLFLWGDSPNTQVALMLLILTLQLFDCVMEFCVLLL